MLITFKDYGTVKIDTRNYLKEAITSFGEDVIQNVSSPATRKLFDVDNEAEKLNKKKENRFIRL